MKKVLIIDDEEELCLLLRTYLSRKNYETYVCHTLNEGKELYSSILPDILFIDNNLPDGTGWDFAIGTLSPIHPTHIFFISAFNPKLPDIPSEIHYTIIEKPLSFTDLDKKLKGNN